MQGIKCLFAFNPSNGFGLDASATFDFLSAWIADNLIAFHLDSKSAVARAWLLILESEFVNARCARRIVTVLGGVWRCALGRGGPRR